MTTYAWPDAWGANRFEMWVEPNQRVFASAFNPASQQVMDLGGDYWAATLSIPAGVLAAKGAQIEAFLARLRGSQNFVSLYHLKRPLPRGTMRGGTTATWTTTVPSTATWTTVSAAVATWTAGAPYLKTAIAQFATSCTLNMLPGYTLEPGDLFGFANGQTVMYVGSTTLVADANGDMVVEFAPSARSALAAFTPITYDRPAVAFRLRDGKQPPVTWVPGRFEPLTLDLVEAI